MAESTIGTTSRGGDFVVMDTSWDHNGSSDVVIRDNRGTSNSATVDRDTPNARALARRTLSGSRRAPLLRTFVADGCPHYVFRVSRIPRGH